MAKLHFRYASMNAGKSTALLQVAFNYEERGMRVALFTAAIDDRMGEATIGSRIGLARPARVFDSSTAFTQGLVGEVNCVLVDEAQFLTPGQVRDLHRLANLGGIPVICYGLRSDFRGEAFAGAASLLTLADDIQETRTICACQRKATMNMRLSESGAMVLDGDQVAIGGNDQYRAACAGCFYREQDVVRQAAK